MNDEVPLALVDMDGTICKYYEQLEKDVRIDPEVKARLGGVQ